MDDSSWHYGVLHFWWLIFPIIWFIFGILRMSLRHSARLEAMDLLRTYASQGKDPPPELLAYLREARYDGFRRGRRWRAGRGVILAVLAVAFAALAFFGYDPSRQGFVIAAVILGALAIGNFIISQGGRDHGETWHGDADQSSQGKPPERQ